MTIMSSMTIMIKENNMGTISKLQIDTVLGKILKQYRIKKSSYTRTII